MGMEMWWREYELSANAWARWQIGPLLLFTRYGPGEWEFMWHRDPDPMASSSSFSSPSPVEPDPEDHESRRYALRQTSALLNLRPRLADRPVIARPASPLHIPPNQETTLYVSTVVWLNALSEDIVLLEMPIHRPSDTWFGSDTISGELCYASRTQARTSSDLLNHLPHRAITPIVIVNEAGTPLQVEQLRVPVPFLSLYASPEGHLWTESIRLARGADSTEASLELLGGGSLPAECQRVAEPREAAPRHSLVRSFSRLFD